MPELRKGQILQYYLDLAAAGASASRSILHSTMASIFCNTLSWLSLNTQTHCRRGDHVFPVPKPVPPFATVLVYFLLFTVTKYPWLGTLQRKDAAVPLPAAGSYHSDGIVEGSPVRVRDPTARQEAGSSSGVGLWPLQRFAFVRANTSPRVLLPVSTH